MSSASLPSQPQSPRFVSGLCELAADYDVILCDVWGVVHNGAIQYEKATDALRRFRDKGGSVVLITNAPRSRRRVLSFLDKLNVPRQAYDGVVTSGDVTISLIHERAGQPLAYIGPPDDMSLFAEAESSSDNKLRFAGLAKAAYVVCIGLEEAEHETPADYDTRLRLLRDHDAEFICANPDIVVEMGDRLVYCAGALAESYEALGGRVVQAGKPHAEIYTRALTLAAAARGRPIDHARVLAIGDSAHTDIKGGQAQGFDTLFVTSGIHRAELHAENGNGPLNAAALHQFLDNLGFAPTAAAAELLW
jgi:HAD superfamily hydrolase (TIGR01459 family)